MQHLKNLRILVSLSAAALSWSTFSDAAHNPLTRAQIIENVKDAPGNGYQWGGSTWSSDASLVGVCKLVPEGNEDGCPDKCEYPGGDQGGGKLTGSDCSGLISKAWEQSGSHLSNETKVTVRNGAGSFRTAGADWESVSLDDLQAGDAAASSGHVMLFDRLEGSLPVWYEAMGCKWGIKHAARNNWPKKKDSFSGARRLGLEPPRTCEANTCNSHGACSNGECLCSKGFAGRDCDHCDAGYLGYPTCANPSATCKPLGELKCGGTYTIPVSQATKTLSKYACSMPSADGPELTYRFVGTGKGKAKLSLSGGAGLGLLAGSCAAEACSLAGAKSLDIDYSPRSEYYVAVETGGATSDVTVTVECESTTAPWTGDACTTDAKCMLQKADGTPITGRCYKAEGQSEGFCTVDCTNTNGCSDLQDKAPTSCVNDPANDQQGICVPESHELNRNCEAVPGSVKQRLPKRNKPDVTREVCVPPAPGQSTCSGTVVGKVVDKLEGAALSGVAVTARGNKDAINGTTDQDGRFALTVPCDMYDLMFQLEDYQTEFALAKVENQKTIQVPNIELVNPDDCSGVILATGQVLNGITNPSKPIPNVTIEVRNGANATSGEVFEFVKSTDGSYQFKDLMAGTYTFTATASGFATGSTTVTLCNAQSTIPDISLTPKATNAALRIALNWNKPEDLDLHVTLATTEVFYGKGCNGSDTQYPYMVLDVDREIASGPEMVTVSRLLPETYTVFVHNFSQQVKTQYPEEYDLSANDIGFPDSGANVVVYDSTGKELARFTPPTSGSGYFWDVFTFEGGGTTPQNIRAVGRLRDDRPNPDVDYPATGCGVH